MGIVVKLGDRPDKVPAAPQRSQAPAEPRFGKPVLVGAAAAATVAALLLGVAAWSAFAPPPAPVGPEPVPFGTTASPTAAGVPAAGLTVPGAAPAAVGGIPDPESPTPNVAPAPASPSYGGK